MPRPLLILHGLVLALCNLAMLNAAFLLWSLMPEAPQRVFQGGLALVLSTLCFLAWGWISRQLGLASPRGWRQLVMVWIAAAILAAIVFTLMHRLSEGYWTTFGNLLAIWAFQVPANGLALAIFAALYGDDLD